MSTISCDCCRVRYATKKYATGYSYCEPCGKHIFYKGRVTKDYSPAYQQFYPARPDQILCKSCDLCYDGVKIVIVRFECGHSFKYCRNCGPSQEYCPIDQAAVTNDSLSKFL